MKGSLFAFLTSLIFILIQNSPESVKSNISKWLITFNIDPEKLSYTVEQYTYIITPIAYVTIGISLAIIFTSLKKRNNGNVQQVQYNQSVTSHNQSGGITAHKVVLGSQERTLTSELKRELLKTLDIQKKVDFSIAMNDQEAEKYAYEIRNFLIAEGYEMEFRTMQYEAMAGGQGIPYLSTNGDISIILIGPNVKTSEQIQFLGSACRPA
ncbi:hypothetical protein [Vibrio alginolyticus]|uniref:hypothetical protein n=1 Tax=Vibrio alginolyticus TaxID=663 RepID=UPI000DFA7562|nr:hypothetical protein [Vibrio alginolyticus]SUP19582.1 Uncharacterised protein [Vibrio alginolyticus]